MNGPDVRNRPKIKGEMLALRFLFVSLMIHLVLYTGILNTPATWTPPSRAELTEIEVVRQPFNEKGQQVIRQTLVPDKMKIEEDTAARFLSEQKQRVLLETRAQNVGLSQNANPLSPKTQKTQKRDLSGYEPITLPRPQDIQTEGESTVGEALPSDVSVGSFTALNTDAFTFYSFFSRIEELVRFRWEMQVRSAIQTYDYRMVVQNLGKKNWITQIEFLISPDGHLKVSRIMKESGVKGFDLAAVQAFTDAGFFPNPPQELVEEDGYVHLKYSFNVYFEPSAFATR